MTDPRISRYAVVGNPIEHSRSPLIHRLFAEQTGEPVKYGRLLAPLDSFEATVHSFADTGAVGCNVTVPFKFEALEAARHPTRRAALAQAANWLQFNADGWQADNTDGAGLVRDIEVNAGRSLSGKRVLLLGAGGGASGVLGPLLEGRPAIIVVANRTNEKAEALVARHAALARRVSVPLEWIAMGEGVANAYAPFDIVINATSSSLKGDDVPVPGGVIAPGALAIDMMYGAPAQGFLDWAERNGAEGRDGLGMLVEQASEAFFLWRGVRPDTAPVLRELQTTSAKS